MKHAIALLAPGLYPTPGTTKTTLHTNCNCNIKATFSVAIPSTQKVHRAVKSFLNFDIRHVCVDVSPANVLARDNTSVVCAQFSV